MYNELADLDKYLQVLEMVQYTSGESRKARELLRKISWNGIFSQCVNVFAYLSTQGC